MPVLDVALRKCGVRGFGQLHLTVSSWPDEAGLKQTAFINFEFELKRVIDRALWKKLIWFDFAEFQPARTAQTRTLNNLHRWKCGLFAILVIVRAERAKKRRWL